MTSTFEDDQARCLCTSRLVHAWQELSERRRILRGRPLPGEALRILRDPIALKKIAKHAGFEQRPTDVLPGEFVDLDAIVPPKDLAQPLAQEPVPPSTDTPK